MKIAIRVDASVAMGTGHVMRCLTLAIALRQRGAAVHFICRLLPGHLMEHISRQGFPLSPLAAPERYEVQASESHERWLGVEAAQDAMETGGILAGLGTVDWLVVDHYGLGADWERRLRAHVRRLFVIDDLADRAHDCDVLLDQNHYHALEQRYDGLLPAGSRKLLGPRYALLREEFGAARKTLRARDGRVKRVLVFFGGVDAGDETSKAIDSLERIADPDITIDVVVGAANLRAGRLSERCAKLPFVRFHAGISNMAELMAAADLAVGAGGTTTWERAALGLPSLVVALVKNQEELSAAVADHGCIVLLEKPTVADIEAVLRVLFKQPALLRHMQSQNLDLVDGRGARRVARVLSGASIRLRTARLQDSENLFQWRNSEFVRADSLNPAPIPRATHEAWLAASLANPDRDLLIAESAGEPVGVLRYDLAAAQALVSIYLVPGRSGHGHGPSILEAGEDWLLRNRPAVKEVLAEILDRNQASRSAFADAGFLPHRSVFRKALRS